MSRLLKIIPYPHLFPPRNGGHLRAFYLLKELARSHEVHAILMQPESELAGERDGYRFPGNVTVYSPVSNAPPKSAFRYLGKKLGTALHSRFLRGSWSEPASSVVLNTHHLIRQILGSNRIDVVVFTELSSLAVAPLIRRLAPNATRIMDMQNVDHVLLEQELESLPHPSEPTRARFRRAAARLRSQEESLSRHVDAFWATSDNDKAAIDDLNHGLIPGQVIPNGVDVDMRPFDDRPSKASSGTVLFCGTLDYLPNRDGLLWFYESVWPKIRSTRDNARLAVVGRGADESDFASIRSDPSVEFVGEVDDVVPHYWNAGVCVVPLRLGSGTRLKIPEAMSLGNPVVSTTLGAMGLNVTSGVDIALADEPGDFASEVLRLMGNSDHFHAVRIAARKLVDERYDWRVIGRKMDESIDALVADAR
jgi:polysaccharide biosynthesis protein PslH